MNRLVYLLYGLIIFIAVLLIAVPILISIGKIILKESNKRIIVGSVITAFSGFLIIYLLFHGGEYTKQKISKDTINRLLNLSVESINMDLFSAPEYAYEKDDYIYDFELDNSTVTGTISISRYEEKTISLYHGEHFARTYTDDDSFVYIDARTAKREFSEIPLIQNYLNTIYIINNNYLIEIRYWEYKNRPETVNMILDSIIK